MGDQAGGKSGHRMSKHMSTGLGVGKKPMRNSQHLKTPRETCNEVEGLLGAGWLSP